MNEHGRFWMTTGARLGFAAVLLIIALIVAFVAVPFYADRAQREQQERQNRIELVQRQKATQQFLHTFDCTYGVSLKSVLTEAERTYRKSAQISLVARHDSLRAGDRARANTNLKARRNALKTADRYHRLNVGVKKLGGERPCR